MNLMLFEELEAIDSEHSYEQFNDDYEEYEKNNRNNKFQDHIYDTIQSSYQYKNKDKYQDILLQRSIDQIRYIQSDRYLIADNFCYMIKAIIVNSSHIESFYNFSNWSLNYYDGNINTKVFTVYSPWSLHNKFDESSN